METFLKSIPTWNTDLKDYDTLIFDTNVFIDCIELKAEGFFDELETHFSTNILLPIVEIEFMRTDNSIHRTVFSDIKSKYFRETPVLARNNNDFAKDIQEYLYSIGTRPEPTDLFLGGYLCEYPNNGFIVTSDLKGFPFPLYERVFYLLIQNNNSLKTISFLKINRSVLDDYKSMVQKKIQSLRQ